MSDAASTSDILLRLARRSDLPADVIATLFSVAELAVLREHQQYASGMQNARVADRVAMMRGPT